MLGPLAFALDPIQLFKTIVRALIDKKKGNCHQRLIISFFKNILPDHSF
jgi:hypothetical protein